MDDEKYRHTQFYDELVKNGWTYCGKPITCSDDLEELLQICFYPRKPEDLDDYDEDEWDAIILGHQAARRGAKRLLDCALEMVPTDRPLKDYLELVVNAGPEADRNGALFTPYDNKPWPRTPAELTKYIRECLRLDEPENAN